MKTLIHIKIVLLTILSIAAVQANGYPPRSESKPPEQPWKSGETIVTLSDDGTLTVSGSGAMEDYAFGRDNFVPWKSAIKNSSSINAIVIEKGVTHIGENAFWGIYLKTITVVADNAHYTSEDGILFNKNKTILILYPLGRQQDAYIIPNSVTTIGKGSFSGCRDLSSVTIPNSVITIDERAFSGVGDLTSINIPNSVTDIGTKAFFQSDLTSITIPGSVKNIGAYAFAECDRLTSVTIENGVESIGSSAFYECKSLTAVTIPQSVTSIGTMAFMECRNLTSVTIPGSVTSIEDLAFALSGLSSVTIGNGVAKIGTEVFHGCNLMAVTLPRSVAYIGDKAFFRCCEKWASITILNPQPPKLGTDPFSNVYLYVPIRSYFAYRATDGWNEYGLRVFFNIYEIITLCILSLLLLSAVVFAIVKKSRKIRHGS